MAMDLAETMAEEAIDYLPDTMSTLAPNLAQHAKLPESKVAPSYTKFTMIGALLGLLICAAFFIVKYLMDDTIHTCLLYTSPFLLFSWRLRFRNNHTTHLSVNPIAQV